MSQLKLVPTYTAYTVADTNVLLKNSDANDDDVYAKQMQTWSSRDLNLGLKTFRDRIFSRHLSLGLGPQNLRLGLDNTSNFIA